MIAQDELIEALRPFAKLLDEWENDGDTPPIRRGQQYITMPVAVSDLRRARAALASASASSEEIDWKQVTGFHSANAMPVSGEAIKKAAKAAYNFWRSSEERGSGNVFAEWEKETELQDDWIAHTRAGIEAYLALTAPTHRDEIIEKCAKVAEAFGEQEGWLEPDGDPYEIAGRIRALKDSD